MKAFPDAAALRTPRALNDLLLYRLWRATRTSRAMATRIVEGGFGITHREWGMIGMLAQVGEIRPSALAEQLRLDRVSISRGLRGLFEKQLIEKRRDADDAREVHVKLSAAGRRLFDALLPRIADLNIELLDGIDLGHHAVFLECLRQLELRGDALSAQYAIPEKISRRSGGTRPHWPGLIDIA